MDWLFMIGLLTMGLALILGVGTHVSAVITNLEDELPLANTRSWMTTSSTPLSWSAS